MSDSLYVLLCEDFLADETDCPKNEVLLVTDTSLLADQLDPIERYFMGQYDFVDSGSISIKLNSESTGDVILKSKRRDGTYHERFIGIAGLIPVPTKFYY